MACLIRNQIKDHIIRQYNIISDWEEHSEIQAIEDVEQYHPTRRLSIKPEKSTKLATDFSSRIKMLNIGDQVARKVAKATDEKLRRLSSSNSMKSKDSTLQVRRKTMS